MEKVILFDTTMRDGRQCPGADVTDGQYFDYMKLISRSGMDIVEAGFPSSSKREFVQVRRLAEMAGSGEFSPSVAALCQSRREQVDSTLRALEPAVGWEKAFFHVYIPVDPRLLSASMGDIDTDSELQKLEEHIKIAKRAGMTVQFSPEGYSRIGSNFDWCTDLIRVAVSSGATYINCPDTIGGASHYEWEQYYVENMRRHKEVIDREYPWNSVVWSVHNHNDLGNATENSIWWVVNGVARKIEGTIGWVGERAGNADLLQVVMNMRQFHSQKYDTSHIDIAWFHEIGRFVGQHMLPIQPHYPIIWGNAYRHTSGGHVNALRRDRLVYHPYDPESVGWSISLWFGPQSGGNHARDIVEQSGISFAWSPSEFAQFLKSHHSDRRKGISDEEVIAWYRIYRETSTNRSIPA